MDKHCLLVQVDDSYTGAIAGFLKFREQYRGRPGKELLAKSIFFRARGFPRTMSGTGILHDNSKPFIQMCKVWDHWLRLHHLASKCFIGGQRDRGSAKPSRDELQSRRFCPISHFPVTNKGVCDDQA